MSLSLDLDRQVPEFNNARCLKVNYDEESLPSADVIIVFHNEDLSVLLRSVHSILNRSPPKLLHQIILVNDDSNATSHPWLFDQLPAHVEVLPKTRLIHLSARRGLMMARMEGAKEAHADVSVFLDSHIECTNRWLEPMLSEIQKNRKMLVTPMIHSINADNFVFEPGAVGVVGFTWSLGQSHPHRATNDFDPLPSPVMAGGLFAGDRKWFAEELGGYDPEMKLYGGEEMEIGFKAWQCGGGILALPCSRVGHIFRTDKFWKGQVYKVPFEEIIRNKRRAAEVWLDEYKEIAFLAMSDLPKNMTLGPLEEVRAVRARLNCKPFKWYLQNVYPDLWAPDLSLGLKGALTNEETHGCLDTLQAKETGPIGVYPCHNMHGSQAFIMDEDGSVRAAATNFKTCVSVSKDKTLALSSECKTSWHFSRKEEGNQFGLLQLKGSNSCLRSQKGNSVMSPLAGVMADCSFEDAAQMWHWT